MSEIIIRQAELKDIDDIYEIEQLCFPDSWSMESLEYEFKENPNAFYVVAEQDDRVIGYAGLWGIFDEGHITNVAVRPECRGKHIGQSIMTALLDFTIKEGLMHHTLEVRVSNDPAIKMYEKFGFKVEGRRKAYYANNGEDALIMWRHQE